MTGLCQRGSKEVTLSTCMAHRHIRAVARPDKCLLQVCKRWRAVAARNLLTLRPVIPKIHRFVTMFPSLTNLDLSGALLTSN